MIEGEHTKTLQNHVKPNGHGHDLAAGRDGHDDPIFMFLHLRLFEISLKKYR